MTSSCVLHVKQNHHMGHAHYGNGDQRRLTQKSKGNATQVCTLSIQRGEGVGKAHNGKNDIS